MLCAFGSVKASPGVTTTVAGLTTVWPADRALLVAELDPAGGDLAARNGLHDEPGLVTLAAAGRRELDPETVLAHCQRLPFPGAAAGTAEPNVAERRVLIGPPGTDQAMAAMAALRGRMASTLAALPGIDVLVDCGRLDTTSPALEVVVAADIVVVVSRGALSDVHHLQSRFSTLHRPDALLVVVGDRPYPAPEIAAAIGYPAHTDLPIDRRAADALTGLAPIAPRALRRTSLLRRLAELASSLIGYASEPDRSGAAPKAPAPPPVPPPWAPPTHPSEASEEMST